MTIRRELPSIYPFSSSRGKCVGETKGGFSRAHGVRRSATSATSRSQPGGEALQEGASFVAEQHSM